MRSQAIGSHDNNFGFLRLLFAALVILSHSPELIDGNRSREILTSIFATMSFGEIAVDGFFIVSGFLITKSFAERPQAGSFLVKRVLRIVPGYLLSFWLCILLLAPLVGAAQSVLSFETIKNGLFQSFILLSPHVSGVFHGLPYPALNGSMWTIAYELRCYLAVALLGALGRCIDISMERARFIVLFFVALGLVVNSADFLHESASQFDCILGLPKNNIRFFAVFGVGSLFYLFKDWVTLSTSGALRAVLLLVASLFFKQTAEAGMALFGGYLIFWFAFKCKTFEISIADNKTDISYGLYLYAWPIQSFIIWNDRTIDPWLLCLITLFGAGLAGFASWHFIEKRALRLAYVGRSATPPAAASPAISSV